MVFKDHYELFGQQLECTVIPVAAPFKLEADVYKVIKKLTEANKWQFIRIDNSVKSGWPDITLLREDCYNLIEAKMLKRKKLVDIADNLNFEFGQLPFAVRSLKLRINYTLAVGKGNQLALIQGAYNPWDINK